MLPCVGKLVVMWVKTQTLCNYNRFAVDFSFEEELQIQKISLTCPDFLISVVMRFWFHLPPSLKNCVF